LHLFAIAHLDSPNAGIEFPPCERLALDTFYVMFAAHSVGNLEVARDILPAPFKFKTELG